MDASGWWFQFLNVVLPKTTRNNLSDNFTLWAAKKRWLEPGFQREMLTEATEVSVVFINRTFVPLYALPEICQDILTMYKKKCWGLNAKRINVVWHHYKKQPSFLKAINDHPVWRWTCDQAYAGSSPFWLQNYLYTCNRTYTGILMLSILMFKSAIKTINTIFPIIKYFQVRVAAR